MRAHRVAARVLNDPDEACDVAQEVIIEFYRSALLNDLVDVDSSETQILGRRVAWRAFRRALGALRKRLRATNIAQSAIVAGMLAAAECGPSPDDAFALAEAYDNLGDDAKRAFVLSFLLESGSRNIALENVVVAARALADLPRIERDPVLYLCFFGLKYNEAAKALDIPQGTLASRYKRGIRKFAEAIAHALGVAANPAPEAVSAMPRGNANAHELSASEGSSMPATQADNSSYPPPAVEGRPENSSAIDVVAACTGIEDESVKL
jgi:DNA-directed RNA polymerase specialized sigma24 family protein